MQPREIFKLDKMLGFGGFGTTYRAFVIDEKHRKKWGDVVVLKIPHDDEKEFALIEELIINNYLHMQLTEIKSENIVKYLGFEKYGKNYVMVMEYIDGESLRNKIGIIGHQKPLSIEETIRITKQICKGLSEVHNCRIFHRDIKPDNIMIARKDNVVKLTDLGISTLIKSSELASSTTGTIAYMPKEIIKGQGGSFYSDIYSLGVTIYEMITGQLPFDGESYVEIIENICTKDPVAPKTLNPEINDNLNTILLKALSKDFHDRYKSVGELLHALERYEKGADVEIEEAWQLFQQDCFTESENKFRKLIEMNPDNPKFYLHYGEFFNRCQRNKEAINILQTGILKDSKYALLYRNLAFSLYLEGKKQEAIENLKKAIEIGLEEGINRHAKILLDKWEHFN